MKKLHIFLLIAVAGAVAALLSFMGDLTTYDTVASARQKPDQFVHLIARLDRTKPVQYDPVMDPNYCVFTVVDSLGNSARVISHKPKPVELEQSERVVLKGRMLNNEFQCDDILLKCPSKYKDDQEVAKKKIQTGSL